MLFATLLWVQTRRVRCVFEKDSFEFYNIKGPKLDLNNGAKLVQKPDNYVSGTINRWKYDTITNYGFFPSLDVPVICYFKETETPEVSWFGFVIMGSGMNPFGFEFKRLHRRLHSAPPLIMILMTELLTLARCLPFTGTVGQVVRCLWFLRRRTAPFLSRHLQCSPIQGTDGASWSGTQEDSNLERLLRTKLSMLETREIKRERIDIHHGMPFRTLRETRPLFTDMNEHTGWVHIYKGELPTTTRAINPETAHWTGSTRWNKSNSEIITPLSDSHRNDALNRQKCRVF